MSTAKMLPASLLSTLDSRQLEDLLDATAADVARIKIALATATAKETALAASRARMKAARAAYSRQRIERAQAVLKLVKRGLSNSTIAERLGCCTRTVDRCLARIRVD